MQFLRFDEYLNERKELGVLYHFTDYVKLKANTNNFTAGKLEYKFRPRDSSKYIDSFLSLTRLYNYNWCPIRFALDGEKLSDAFQIEPIHWYNNTGNYLYNFGDLRKYGSDFGFGYGPMNQYEERILDKHHKNKIDLLKYLIRVDICITNAKYFAADITANLPHIDQDDDDLMEFYKDHISELEKYFKSLHVPFAIVDDFTPVKYY